MPAATSEDTEITLGTGKMLALFFGLVGLCAVFFAFGFSLGKNSVLKPSAAEASLPAPTPAPAILRPSAVKTETNLASSAEINNAAPDKAPDAQTTAAAIPAPATDAGAPNGDAKSASADPVVPPALNGYYVQVAAVSKEEDADALVDALKKKQYPAFSAGTSPDKLFHVQLGPYGDIKDAEAMRAKLVSDGYNPILKK
jgi:DedD protein